MLENNTIAKITKARSETTLPFNVEYRIEGTDTIQKSELNQAEVNHIIELLENITIYKQEKIQKHELIEFTAVIIDGQVMEGYIIDPLTIKLAMQLQKVLEISKIGTFFGEKVKITIEAIE